MLRAIGYIMFTGIIVVFIMITKDMIDEAIDRIPFKAGDRVKVIATGQIGTASYIYYNGFVLVDFGKPIIGGIFNNNSTYRVAALAGV